MSKPSRSSYGMPIAGSHLMCTHKAVNSNKRAAQSKVVKMMVPNLGEMKDQKTLSKWAVELLFTHIEPRFRCHIRSIRPISLFGMCGGDDGARTRDLCRDRMATQIDS